MTQKLPLVIYHLGNIFEWSIIGECGETTDQVTINVINGNPEINVQDIVYCLEPISLNVNVEGKVCGQ